jgi:hypothetical protein
MVGCRSHVASRPVRVHRLSSVVFVTPPSRTGGTTCAVGVPPGGLVRGGSPSPARPSAVPRCPAGAPAADDKSQQTFDLGAGS